MSGVSCRKTSASPGLQIIAGRFRGVKLASPPGRECRPTLSRIRQTLFNILSPALRGSRFLDLYAGTGSIGLEAYSQGAAGVWLVEQDRDIFRLLQANAARLDPGQAAVRALHLSAEKAAAQFVLRRERFDLIFLDPPYALDPFQAWTGPGLGRLLTERGTLILQHGKRLAPPAAWSGCTLGRSNKYGETRLSFFHASADITERQDCP